MCRQQHTRSGWLCGLSLGKKIMSKIVVQIPRSGIKSHLPATGDADTSFYQRIRTAFVIITLLIYIVAMTYIVRNQIPWAPATIMGLFIFAMVLGVSQKIRPGTSGFWKIFGFVGLIYIAPHLAVNRMSTFAVITLFLLGILIVCIRGYSTYKEETLGWRSIAVGGIIASILWVVLGALSNLGII